MTRPLLLLLATLFLTPGLSWAEDLRDQSLVRLNEAGFQVSPSLPRERGLTKLRPQSEIESRLKAMHAVTLWVAAPPTVWSDQQIRSYIQTEKLSAWHTEEEKAILALSRDAAREQYLDSIGWTMENMWALAWVLGFPDAPALSGQLQGDQARQLVFRFLPLPGEAATFRLRELEKVRAQEDLFYCAHNAVRNAQLGGHDTVPPGFDPVSDGGGIHERRHGLTWCLSPGVTWEETDLST